MANARQLSLDLLMEVLEAGAYSNRCIDEYLVSNELSDADRRLFTRISLGTIEKLLPIDAIIGRYSKTPVRKLRPQIRNILRLSIYQLVFMDKIPASACCNEAVKLAKKRGFSSLSGFINGVLRAISADLENKNIIKELENSSISMAFSIPEWIIDMWRSDYGEELTLNFCQSFGQSRGICVQIFEKRVSEKTLVERWINQDIIVEPVAGLKRVFKLKNAPSLPEISGWNEGYFYIQDESTLRAVSAANPTRGEKILDVCAAPGGKSLYACNLTDDEAMIEARDISVNKIDRVLDNINKSGFNNIKFKIHDALKPDSSLVGRFDLVIADLPCSGLGVLGKRPEIRYRISKEDIEALAKLQSDILDTVCTYVRDGGRLMYSTCTLSRLENEDNVIAFLDRHKDFILKEEKMVMPRLGECDGFYYSILEKR